MNFKSFFLTCLLALTLFFACTETNISAKSKSEVIQTVNADGYTYVRVYIDGIPWIFVYDDKGNLVLTYPEQ